MSIIKLKRTSKNQGNQTAQVGITNDWLFD